MRPPARTGSILLKGLLPGLVLLLVGCSGERWEEHRNEIGRFVVRMPGRPVENKPAEKGVSRIALPQQSGEYTVAWQDLPEGHPTSAGAQLDKSLEQLQGTEVSRRALLLQGKYPGQEMVADWAKGRVKGRVFIVENRVYTLVVSGAPWWVESAAADTFLDSFALIEED